MKKNIYFALTPVLGLALALGSVAVATPGHGYVSVAGGGFSPHSDDCDYENTGTHVTSNSGPCYFFAPVQLPQNATVTKLTTSWYDENASFDGLATLYRVSTQAGGIDAMAMVFSEGDSGSGTSYTTTITYNPIDNSEYAYFVEWTMADVGIYGKNIVIEYTYQASLPAVLRSFQSSLRGR